MKAFVLKEDFDISDEKYRPRNETTKWSRTSYRNNKKDRKNKRNTKRTATLIRRAQRHAKEEDLQNETQFFEEEMTMFHSIKQWHERAKRDFAKLKAIIRADPRHRVLMRNYLCNDPDECRVTLASCLELCRRNRASVRWGENMTRLALLPRPIQLKIISMRYNHLLTNNKPFIPGIYVKWLHCFGGEPRERNLCVLVLYPGMTEAMIEHCCGDWPDMEWVFWWDPTDYASYFYCTGLHFYSTYRQLCQHLDKKPGSVPPPQLLVDFALDPTNRAQRVLRIEGSNDLSFDSPFFDYHYGRIRREEYTLVAPF